LKIKDFYVIISAVKQYLAKKRIKERRIDNNGK
jgi:hypothetical protein